MMDNLFADRVKGLKGSAIREIFKLIQQPDVISFAGGLPAPEMFPAKELAEIAQEVLLNNGTTALQYSVTEGYGPLKEIVKQRMDKAGIGKKEDDIAIMSGGQQGIDLTAKVFLNEGDGIICENPSFIGALNAFRAYNAKLFPVTLENDGMCIEQVENILKANNHVKLIYTIPTFQNPAGITMSLEKRQKLLEMASKHNIYIIEDNPYGDLRFKGQDVPTIKSMDQDGRVIYVGSFSKILSPGLRLGWIVARSDILQKVIIVKQVNDVHTNIFAQVLATQYLLKYCIDEHIKKIRALYGKKCGFMLECMDKYFPDYCEYTRPEGGLFIWCTLPDRYDSVEIMKQSVQHKVAFVPGNTFMADMEKPCSSFRLNYSTMTEEKIEQGIKTLGEVLKSIDN
ncbi:PLP-dependent aminotransferase family protein [Petroclostridium xylanilyticum]|jgi:2-aminoadipate transaminase|uniref:aminotransferase-like domain-containing protein n=1 Tax=Petroclostridium xylanilyticum TaxID=1792311 RepID=UPI00311981D0